MSSKNHKFNHKLAQGSEIYTSKANIYDLFSQAEDKPELVKRYFEQELKNKVVLDVGCGNGKYANLLASVVKGYVGLDSSDDQLKIARKKVNGASNVHFTHAYVHQTNTANNSFDAVIATWVIESIRNPSFQSKSLDEMMRVLKYRGSCYVIENSGNSEFDEIIRRTPDISTTKETRESLYNRGFEEVEKFESYFLFPSMNEAKSIFQIIWNQEIADRIQSERIEHNISVYKKVKL